MVVGQGAMALAGPHLTKAVTGEDISMEGGGAKVHCGSPASATSRCKDDPECIQAVKDYLSYFPANCEERPPIAETKDPTTASRRSCSTSSRSRTASPTTCTT